MRRPLDGMILLLAAVALVATSCGGSSSSTSTTSSQTPSGTAFAIPSPIVPFGLYLPVPATSSSAAYAGPSTPTSLANVDLAPSEKAELKQVPALGPMLEKQGFGVVRSGSSLFQSEYEGNIYGGFPVYVTTDAAYNSFHLVFDKTLRDLEQKVLLPKLSLLVAACSRTRTPRHPGSATRRSAAPPPRSSSSTRSRPPSSGRRSRSGRSQRPRRR